MAIRRVVRRIVIGLLMAAAVVGVANIPTSTSQGVNYVVTTHSMPLYLKALDFVDRDIHYRRLSAEITRDAASDEAKAIAAFDWTREHIRPTPSGLPVIDDHIWHIIVRGYGQSDQQADVFTTLSSYAGVPAYWILVGPGPGKETVLSLVKIDGRWRVADVAAGTRFRSRSGQWASAEELAADVDFMSAQAPGASEYRRFFDGFHAPIPPDLTRADMQVPGARTWFQLRRLFRPGLRSWGMRQ